MPFRQGTSIFSRTFKRRFNQKKYMNYMAKEGEEYTHMGFISSVDLIAGRIGLTVGLSFIMLTLWFCPDYFHETFGHFPPPPSYEKIDNALKGQEKKLNQELIRREHEEHKLESYMEIYTSYE